DAVDAGDRGDDDDVVPLQNSPGRRVPHPVYLLVYGRVFFDISICSWYISFRLVVVVVRDEILDRVVGEEALELAVELGGEGLVGGEDQGGALGLLDDLGHGEGLARAGDAEQDLVALALPRLGDELGDG